MALCPFLSHAQHRHACALLPLWVLLSCGWGRLRSTQRQPPVFTPRRRSEGITRLHKRSPGAPWYILNFLCHRSHPLRTLTLSPIHPESARGGSPAGQASCCLITAWGRARDCLHCPLQVTTVGDSRHPMDCTFSLWLVLLLTVLSHSFTRGCI